MASSALVVGTNMGHWAHNESPPTTSTANCRYRMDYMKFVNYHRETDADVTIGCIPYGSERAKEFGLMKIDNNRRVTVGGHTHDDQWYHWH